MNEWMNRRSKWITIKPKQRRDRERERERISPANTKNRYENENG